MHVCMLLGIYELHAADHDQHKSLITATVILAIITIYNHNLTALQQTIND